jgi:hypothetical protein
MLLIWDRKYTAAAFLCGVACAACKVYFLIPMTVIVFTPWNDGGKFWGIIKRGVVGSIGLLPLYLIAFYNQHEAAIAHATTQPIEGGGVALATFTSNGLQGTTFWTLVQQFVTLDPLILKYITGLIAAGSVGLLIVLVRIRRIEPTPRQLIAIVGASLLSVLVWFLHCDPEYYVMPLPFLFAVLRPRWSVLIVGIGFAFVWLVNLSFGVDNAMKNGVTQGGKTVFVRLYNSYVPMTPFRLHVLSLIVVIITNWVATALLCRFIFSRDSESIA